jgi:hypothetical protein
MARPRLKPTFQSGERFSVIGRLPDVLNTLPSTNVARTPLDHAPYGAVIAERKQVPRRLFRFAGDSNLHNFPYLTPPLQKRPWDPRSGRAVAQMLPIRRRRGPRR